MGKDEKVREIPIHPQLRTALGGWLDERPDWPGTHLPALFLNPRGSRLSVEGAHDIITAIADRAGLDDAMSIDEKASHAFALRLAETLPPPLPLPLICALAPYQGKNMMIKSAKALPPAIDRPY